MSSFFTLPASQKKRKRSQPSTKLGNAVKDRKSRDDDSISGSDVSDEDEQAQAEEYEGSEDDDEEFEDEDPATKRIRLAEQYLANAQKDVMEDGGFDAADVDQENLRRRMGERLKEDTAESKGKLYRWIAEGLDWSRSDKRICRQSGLGKCFTGVAIHGRHVYAVTKDIQLIKWDVPSDNAAEKGRRVAKQPKIVAQTRGNRKDRRAEHHTRPILCIQVSPDGKYVATGGADNKLIVWDASTLKPLKMFTQHRDSVLSLAFRRGSNQLFSASKDRTIKIWSLDELAYVETLFGHQDEAVDVSALAREKCVTAGARDRTARLWNVVEESNLVFRGGGAPGTTKALESLRRAYEDDSGVDMQDEKRYNEGSIDRVAMIDDDNFLTGSDNGSISLWNIHKKKPVFTLPLAHGLDPPIPLDEASAEQEPDETLNESGRGGKQPRWITALKVIPFSDTVLSGSWDGYVRAWKISQDKRHIEALGAVGTTGLSVESLLEKEGLSSESVSNAALDAMKAGQEKQSLIKGIVNDISIVEKGDRGRDGLLIAAALGKEHRLGRWKEMQDGRNQVVVFDVPKKSLETNDEIESSAHDEGEGLDDFNGFD